MGISQEHQKNIFSYGYTTKLTGTGQGLHSVANFMNMVGGSVSFESELEKGSIFTLLFPANIVNRGTLGQKVL